MLINEYGSITVIGCAAFGFMMLFGLQLMCCFFFDTLTLRLVPVYMVAASLGLTALTYIAIRGISALGALLANGIAGALISLLLGVAAAGIIAGWLVWFIVRGRK